MKRAGGFSLVTLVIALGLFSVGILAITSLLPVGNVSVRRVVSSTTAAAIAERELGRIRVEHRCPDTPPPERLAGEDPAGYRWEAEIEGEGIYTVTLVVSWLEGGDEKSEIFTTRFTPRLSTDHEEPVFP